ncbi:uncharacterized protein LOC128734954 [Sabethes cyaneus]|uniref:uncharacterized protein LOC128734954 n=1 Tax=Sabethes cyaneus TaxID=53552 RepID=UPI00237DDA27|nr:uncharacterized protein LOC128734954 [Sabethes cyaneus]
MGVGDLPPHTAAVPRIMGTNVITRLALIAALIIAVSVEHSLGAPPVPAADTDSAGQKAGSTDPAVVVRLIHYLSYLIDYAIRTYVTDWAMTSPKEASEYFDNALVAGRLNEPRVDQSKQHYKPDDGEAEQNIKIIDTIRRH